MPNFNKVTSLPNMQSLYDNIARSSQHRQTNNVRQNHDLTSVGGSNRISSNRQSLQNLRDLLDDAISLVDSDGLEESMTITNLISRESNHTTNRMSNRINDISTIRRIASTGAFLSPYRQTTRLGYQSGHTRHSPVSSVNMITSDGSSGDWNIRPTDDLSQNSDDDSFFISEDGHDSDS